MKFCCKAAAAFAVVLSESILNYSLIFLSIFALFSALGLPSISYFAFQLKCPGQDVVLDRFTLSKFKRNLPAEISCKSVTYAFSVQKALRVPSRLGQLVVCCVSACPLIAPIQYGRNSIGLPNLLKLMRLWGLR